MALLGVSLTFGWITHAIMARFNRRHIYYYLAGATLVGGALTAAVLDRILRAAFHMTPWTVTLKIEIVAFGACVAALTAALFWLIRRPDRDLPNPDRATP